MKKIFTLAFSLCILSAAFAQPSYSKQGYPSDNRNGGYTTPAPDRGGVYNDSRSGGYNNSTPVVGRGYGRDDRDERFDHHYNEQFSFSTRERDARIAQINNEYQSRMDMIRFNRFMRNWEKRSEFRRLEDERAQEIRMVSTRFDDNRNKFNDRNYDRDYNWRH